MSKSNYANAESPAERAAWMAADAAEAELARAAEWNAAQDARELAAGMTPETIGTIDITPSAEGYARIAARFADSVLRDVKKARQEPSRELLVSLVEIAIYLGATDPQAASALLRQVKAL